VIEISDLGGASVEDTWNLDGPPSGRDENGCVPYTTGDKSDTVCVPDTGDGEEPALAVKSSRRWSWPSLAGVVLPA
jgi:hypothetical protein